ncbi:protocadherin-11 X-linked [Striga asiatica]|uniref:Protocadherin-11 X-linked n=1 Tax=Striga asiatica TaxID=4170 RepID=A0A5A7Q1V6_STRAF|nr:protocadherin-11 X-linked [Striga asiatica]
MKKHENRALTMSPEQSQYIWRKTIPHIEVGMGSSEQRGKKQSSHNVRLACVTHIELAFLLRKDQTLIVSRNGFRATTDLYLSYLSYFHYEVGSDLFWLLFSLKCEDSVQQSIPHENNY